jgi:hypothetical protein
MKFVAIGAAVAAIGIGLSVANDPASQQAVGTTSFPPGCAIAVAGAPGFVPRAAVTIENRTAAPVEAWLEVRGGLARVDFGVIGEGEIRVLAPVLPAGRNLLRAVPARGGAVRRAVLNVANHGAATCKRRYVWRIE